MKSKHVALLLVPLALVWNASASALPIPISSSLVLSANSNAGGNTVTADFDTQLQGATVNPLTASVRASAVNGNASVDTFASASAIWANPASGNVSFRDVGWATSNASDRFASAIVGPTWTYFFTADATGFFTMSWNIFDSGSTDTFGLNSFLFEFHSFSEGGVEVLRFASSGTLERPIVAGTTYRAHLGGQANLQNNLGTRRAEMDALFNWNVTTADVPEPSMLALTALGLGLLSVFRRKLALR